VKELHQGQCQHFFSHANSPHSARPLKAGIRTNCHTPHRGANSIFFIRILVQQTQLKSDTNRSIPLIASAMPRARPTPTTDGSIVLIHILSPTTRITRTEVPWLLRVMNDDGSTHGKASVATRTKTWQIVTSRPRRQTRAPGQNGHVGDHPAISTRHARGTGVEHSEFNPSATKRSTLINLSSTRASAVSRQSVTKSESFRTSEKQAVCGVGWWSPDGRDSSLTIHHGTRAFTFSNLAAGSSVTHGWPQIDTQAASARESVRVGDQELARGP